MRQLLTGEKHRRHRRSALRTSTQRGFGPVLRGIVDLSSASVSYFTHNQVSVQTVQEGNDSAQSTVHYNKSLGPEARIKSDTKRGEVVVAVWRKSYSSLAFSTAGDLLNMLHPTYNRLHRLQLASSEGETYNVDPDVYQRFK